MELEQIEQAEPAAAKATCFGRRTIETTTTNWLSLEPALKKRQ
jgi:hypothetical protein